MIHFFCLKNKNQSNAWYAWYAGMHGMRGTLERLLISQVSKGLGHLSDSVKTVSPHY